MDFYKANKENEVSFINELNKIASEIKEINCKEREMIIRKLSPFEKLFSNKLSVADTPAYRLKIKQHKSVVKKSYPVPMTFRERTRIALQEMEAALIIERSDSDYCNPLHIVVKSDGTVSVCLDARFINRIIEADHEDPL